MKLETRFSVGQTVYDKTGAKMIIDSIDINATDRKMIVIYKCKNEDGRWVILTDDELTEKRHRPYSVYELQNGDSYFQLYSDGSVHYFVVNGNVIDEDVISQGNIFLTEKEAKKEAKRRAIHEELKALADGYKFEMIEGLLERGNHYLEYSHVTKGLFIRSSKTFETPNTVYFPTEKDAKFAVEIIGAERIIRDYFGKEIDV